MDMLLRHVTMQDLAGLYERNAGASPVPYLLDPATVQRARRLARKSRVWAALDELDPDADVVAFRGSWFRRLRETKDRRLAAYYQRRSVPLERAALAVWLDHPHGDIDYLQDLLWAYCEDSTWVHGVHDQCDIDLNAAAMGARLAEIVHVLGDSLDAAVRDRVVQEVERRIFERFWNYGKMEWWKTATNNWNHVCNGSVLRAALLLLEDPGVLAHMTHAAIQNLTYALDGFADDGGCVEGPAYWQYGFGHYLMAADALCQRTGGGLDIMTDPKTERICRFPLAAHIDGPLYASFADAGHAYLPAWIALLINRFHHIPELYALCAADERGKLRLEGMRDLALYEGQKAGDRDDRDSELPAMGQVKLRGAAGAAQLTVMALAGHNGVSHNHNDVGSFIVHRAGRCWLVDPGAPMYTEQTFSPRRYEIIYCRSRGHSVPLIDGKEQRAGARHSGTLVTENLNGPGTRRAIIQMAGAYPRGTVSRLTRILTLDGDRNTLELTDEYALRRPPQALEEAFITFDRARVARDGRSVRIGSRAAGLTVRALDTPGRFAATVLEEESRAHQRTDDIITRITFTPAELASEMTLRFAIS